MFVARLGACRTMRRRREAGSSAPPGPKLPALPTARRPRRGALCASCALVLLTAVLLCGGSLAASAVVHGRSLTPQGVFAPVNFFFMKLARDLSRVKARRRRFGQENALMPVLMGREEPLPLADPSDIGIALTAEELAEFDGRFLPDSTERAPLYLAIRARIYDVSAAWPFYGPGKSYYGLVGRDATRAFCTGCLEEACLISSLHGLTETQTREADRWVELYEHHDKYHLVGLLREPPPGLGGDGDEAAAEADDTSPAGPEAPDEWEQEQLQAAQRAERSKVHRPFKAPV